MAALASIACELQSAFDCSELGVRFPKGEPRRSLSPGAPRPRGPKKESP